MRIPHIAHYRVFCCFLNLSFEKNKHNRRIQTTSPQELCSYKPLSFYLNAVEVIEMTVTVTCVFMTCWLLPFLPIFTHSNKLANGLLTLNIWSWNRKRLTDMSWTQAWRRGKAERPSSFYFLETFFLSGSTLFFLLCRSAWEESWDSPQIWSLYYVPRRVLSIGNVVVNRQGPVSRNLHLELEVGYFSDSYRQMTLMMNIQDNFTYW